VRHRYGNPVGKSFYYKFSFNENELDEIIKLLKETNLSYEKKLVINLVYPLLL
jgi:hypothetical protein